MGRALPFFWILFLFFMENTLHILFPDQLFPLVLIAVIFFALQTGIFLSLALGLWAGALLELFKVGPLGFAAIPMAAIGAFSGFMASKIFRESFLAQVVLPPASVYFFEAVNLKLLWGPTFFFKLLLTALLSPLVFRILKKVTESAPPRRRASWLF